MGFTSELIGESLAKQMTAKGRRRAKTHTENGAESGVMLARIEALETSVRKAIAMLDGTETALAVRRPVADVLKKALGEADEGTKRV